MGGRRVRSEAMVDVIVVVVMVGAFAGAAVASRRRKAQRRARAATVELVVDRLHVRRRMADGREESAHWDEVVSVEVVCTPVRTVDGARAFALVATGTESGCLVPLGIGHDADLLEHMARLPRFRIEEFTTATEHRPPRRTMVWERVSPTVD